MNTIAFYLRLSLADGDTGKENKDESNSIENQRKLLQEFVESRDDLEGEVIEYVDDGYSGTNFNRPGFIQMVEDAKKGKLDVIIVKDFSRLGRDYIGVGDYLEQIFPVLGIRFIAVNSSYDSNEYDGRTMGLEMSISNLVNSLYSKDLSKKYKSAVRTKWKQGKSTAGWAAFGYRKCKHDKNKWELDPVASKYVRMIFDKALKGMSTSEIARFLNENEVPTPGAYREMDETKFKAWNRIVPDEEWLWDTATVWRILKNYIYTGACVSGRRACISVGNRRQRKVPEKDQVIIEGVHPAIVSKEEFYEAQNVINKASKHSMPQKTGFSLTGKIRCGCCGLRMAYTENGEPKVTCPHKRGVGEYSNCDGTIHSAKRIEGIVLYALRMKLALFQNIRDVLVENQKENARFAPAEQKKLSQRIETLKAKRIHQYEAYADGSITKEAYLRSKEESNAEIEHLQGKLKQMQKLDMESNNIAEKVKAISRQAEEVKVIKKLTQEIAERFIATVTIYDQKRIEVSFTFDELLEQAIMQTQEIQKRNETDQAG